MATVTLSWSDPEDAAEFGRIAVELRRIGWLPDTALAALAELVRISTEEGRHGDG